MEWGDTEEESKMLERRRRRRKKETWIRQKVAGLVRRANKLTMLIEGIFNALNITLTNLNNKG